MFNRNRNIDIDPNYYYQQGMQQPYPPQKPSMVDELTRGVTIGIKVLATAWIVSVIYGILLTEGDSWNQKALNFFEQQRVLYQQQMKKVLEEQNISK